MQTPKKTTLKSKTVAKTGAISSMSKTTVLKPKSKFVDDEDDDFEPFDDLDYDGIEPDEDDDY